MEAITLTKSDWDSIMKPILRCTLPKSGIVRTFPRTILYSPISYSGFGIMHPYYLQQIKHIHVCMEQTANLNITHNRLTTNVEQLRLELGIDSSNGNWHTEQSSPYLSTCWIKDLFCFCSEHNIRLQDDCTSLTLCTQNDPYIMEAFLSHYDAANLVKLNHC